MDRCQGREPQLILRLLAPYLAVGVFWCLLDSAWLAVLAYHVQILLWSRGRLLTGLGPASWRRERWLLAAIPFALAGPVLYVLLPLVSQTDLVAWLADRGLAGLPLLLMVPYYGLVHPVLEQTHWTALRRRTPAAHVFFAGYHALVLASLLEPLWLGLCLATLLAASWIWRELDRRTGNARTAVLSHVLADVGVVLVAWLAVAGNH